MIKNNILLLFFLLSFWLANAQTPPEAENDDYSTETNITLNVPAPGVLTNDIDADGDVLIATEFLINGLTFLAGETANIAQGSFTLFANGSIEFLPTTNYNGTLPIINYTISDGTFTDSANITISVINTPPNANNDFDTAEVNTTLTIVTPGVLANDTDADGNVLTVTSFSVDGMVHLAGDTAFFAQGSITINTDGSYLFSPTPNYTGNVPTINYTISDGISTDSANLFLTVENITNLIEISNLSSCNQGYTVDGVYKIQYSMTISNTSTARDYHPTSLIRNIDLTNDLQAIYGAGCAIEVDEATITNIQARDFIGNPYPLEFDDSAINPDFLNATSSSIFNNNAINNLTLYPRQSINIAFCVTINPFCDGRPNPTPSGSGIDFDNVLNVTSNRGNNTNNLLLKDFHTTEAIVTAGLYAPSVNPEVNPNGTFDFTNTVIITNEGTSRADNINYNMGLDSFLNNGIVFNQLTIAQVSGPTVTINNTYNGDTSTALLNTNNSLESGETIILEVSYLIAATSSNNINSFLQVERAQTQGIIDDFDETTPAHRREFSFVTWSDGLGDHLDRYYSVSSSTATASSSLQCNCDTVGIKFSFNTTTSNNKTIFAVNDAPNGILEHEEITFQFVLTNTSGVVQLNNLQLQDNLSAICSGNIISVSAPMTTNSTATTDPVLNTGYNGITDINIFNGSSGLLMANESITVQLTVVFNENCTGINTSNFFATNPLGNTRRTPSNNVNINAFTDSDNDGITNNDDIDDDNDTIPDSQEYNGLSPLNDDDGDFIPNYRDTDFGTDANNDGVIDVFDFDNDGVANHLDLDSDNDGILDIVELGNAALDTNNNGTTNGVVGTNGLDNTIEDNDSNTAVITYTIPNTDGNGNGNFLDIDADADGIVDNIEAQLTASYIPPNFVINTFGIDTAYPNGITPIDSDVDTVFDYLDTNSDNDAKGDIIEGWDFNNDGIAETVASNIDTDNDGLDNAYDINDNLVNPTNGQIPTDFPNADNIDNPERDWREITAIAVIINDISVTEGNDLVFTISLVTKDDSTILLQSALPIDINLSTVNGTDATTIYDVATAPFDYTGITNATLTIPPFTETAQISITSLDDIITELEEIFTINGTITSNNTINTEITGIGTIIDNENLPSITMNNSIEEEGVDLIHTITISNPSSTPVSVVVRTSDATAINPEDYTTVVQVLRIDGTIDPNNANTEATFNITTLNDNLNEADQEILNVVGAVSTTNIGLQDLTKTGTIIDVDPYPIIQIDKDVTVVEGNPLQFTITLVDANSNPMQNYLPINIGIETINETTNFQDYEELSTRITIPAFNTSSVIKSIRTIDDLLNEDTETMLLRATDILNSSSTDTKKGFIRDNDYPNLFSPNSDGKSDVFKISGIEDFPNFTLKIIDRWGSDVYYYRNNGNTNPIWWNGTLNEKPVPEGVYYYTLDFNDGITKPRTNFIQLVR